MKMIIRLFLLLFVLAALPALAQTKADDVFYFGGQGGTPPPAPKFTYSLTGGSLPSGLTYARSGGTSRIIGGCLTLFSTNAPPLDTTGLNFDPVRINQVRQNSITAASNGSLTTGITSPLCGGADTGAVRFTEDTATAGHLLTVGASTISYVNGTTYVVSAFVKPGTLTRLQIFISSTVVTTADCYTNYLMTGSGSISRTGASVTANGITAYSNGWYRIWMRFTANASATQTLSFTTLTNGNELRAPVNIVGSSRTYDLYGGQVEAGTVISNYIPTTSAAVTRDLPSLTVNDVSTVSATEGTFVVQATAPSTINAAGTDLTLMRLSDGTAANYHEIAIKVSDTTARGNTVASSSSQAAVSGGTWAGAATHKAAYRYKANDFGISVDGGLVSKDVSGSVPASLTEVRIGAATTSTGNSESELKFFSYYDTALTDSQQQSVSN
jgi:hypothetical protein